MNWLGRLIRKKQLERELAQEMEDHFQRQLFDHLRSGLNEEEARRKTRLTFGGSEQVREECRDARGTRWLESAAQDLRLAVRLFAKSPGFTLTAVVTLALGIGANTAIFALLDAVRLRSLPVPDPQELALIQVQGGNRFGITRLENSLSYAVWQRIQDYQRGFSSVFAWAPTTFNLGKGNGIRPVSGIWVSGGTFASLRIAPARGRLLAAEDDRAGCGLPGAVISHGLLESQFGGRDPVGKKLFIEGHATEIIGVMPQTFSGLEVGRYVDIALPICSRPFYSADDEALSRSDISFLFVMGRLKQGWTLREASDQLASISPAIFQSTLPKGYEESSHGWYVTSRLTAYYAANGVSLLRGTYDSSRWLLLGITGLVLLIACANLANLMLVRASARQHEMAVRLAIGASRLRLIRQVLAEAFVLAATGAILGASLARLFSRVAVIFLTTQRDSLYLDLSLNWRVFGFAAVVAGFTCVIFGLVPAYRGSQTSPAEAVKTGGRGMTGSQKQGRFQSALVVSQIAVSLVLLITAALLVHSSH